MDDKLIHIGVKGMKWGHRKPEETGEIVRKKGQDVRTITDNSNLKLDARKLYTSFTPKDILRYRGEYADQVRCMRNVEKIFEYKLVALENLVSPSKKERINEMIDLHKNDKNVVREMAKSKVRSVPYLMMAKSFGFDQTQKQAEKYRKLLGSKNPKDQDKALHEFSRLLAASDINRKKYFDRLEKKGYNSVYDDNDIMGSYSDKPLIVFNSAKSLKVVKKTSYDQDATDKAFQELEELE